MKSVAEIREKFQTKASPPTSTSPPPPLLTCLTARPWQSQLRTRKDAGSKLLVATSSQKAKEELSALPENCDATFSGNGKLDSALTSSEKTLLPVSATVTTTTATTTKHTLSAACTSTSINSKGKARSPVLQVKNFVASPYAAPHHSVSNNSDGKNGSLVRATPAIAVLNAGGGKDNSLVSQMKNKFETVTNSDVGTISSGVGGTVPRPKPLLKPKPQGLSSVSDNREEKSSSGSDHLPSVQPEKDAVDTQVETLEKDASVATHKLSEGLIQAVEQVATAWCRRPSNPPPVPPPPKPPKPDSLRLSPTLTASEALDIPPPLPLKPSASFLHSCPITATISPPRRPPPLPPTEIKGKPLPPWPPEESADDGKDVDDLYDDGELISSADAERFPLKSDLDDGNSSQASGDYAEASLPTDSPDQDEAIYEEMETRYDYPPDEAKRLSSADKRLRREQKEQEKRKAKWKDKYNWTEDLKPVESGVAKRNVRGKNHDVGIREGETVRILRIDKNPPGKWLIQNEKGKIGYVDLTNIDVDPDSIRSVMFGPRYETLTSSYSSYSSNTQWVEDEEELYQDISNWSVPLPSPPPR